MFKSFIILLIIFTGLLIIGGWFIFQDKTRIIVINDIKIKVELADTPKERSKGLSKRDKLPENQGMLFIYDTPGFYSFWMKQMQFPIDIIWIDENRQIIDISQNIPIQTDDSELITYTSKQPAQYILEVNARFVEKNNIEIGDSVNVEYSADGGS